ncbi:MAG: SAM-dependent methyltransferase [Acidobacteriia bacterium]|nr:SAM-dependent methyltransferase [Terriglobia bacterium]
MSVQPSLREQIEHEILEGGPIPFSRYMEICLYDPTHGYYSAHDEQFGKAGDFYTSSDVHAVFGRLLARQFDQIWQAFDRPPEIEILELGPGRGLFARDVLDWSKKKFPDFFAALTYTAQESSPALRARLQTTLREHLDAGRAKVPEGRRNGLSRALPPETPIIVFANEFFDALPVEILSTAGKLHLALENHRLHETWLPPLAEELEFLDRYGVHPEAGERIEVPIVAQDWVRQIARATEHGSLVVIVIDYGYTRNQQLAGRHRGTLMAYRQHSASPDPYQAPGKQDLTAHVNFTALAAACEQEGMQVEKLLTQSQFLMGIGENNQFADAFEDCRLPQERAKVALQLKHLVTPVGMGETFQVLVASRGIDSKKTAGLSGLSFGKSSQFSVPGSQ